MAPEVMEQVREESNTTDFLACVFPMSIFVYMFIKCMQHFIDIITLNTRSNDIFYVRHQAIVSSLSYELI